LANRKLNALSILLGQGLEKQAGLDLARV